MTIWNCNLDSGDCLKEVDTVNGDYLCGDCEGCAKCCVCNSDEQERLKNNDY